MNFLFLNNKKPLRFEEVLFFDVFRELFKLAIISLLEVACIYQSSGSSYQKNFIQFLPQIILICHALINFRSMQTKGQAIVFHILTQCKNYFAFSAKIKKESVYFNKNKKATLGRPNQGGILSQLGALKWPYIAIKNIETFYADFVYYVSRKNLSIFKCPTLQSRT